MITGAFCGYQPACASCCVFVIVVPQAGESLRLFGLPATVGVWCWHGGCCLSLLPRAPQYAAAPAGPKVKQGLFRDL
jgi:hypothetical protein